MIASMMYWVIAITCLMVGAFVTHFVFFEVSPHE